MRMRMRMRMRITFADSYKLGNWIDADGFPATAPPALISSKASE
ncbi:hypothetical protein [Kribbella sp. NPDC000426]